MLAAPEDPALLSGGVRCCFAAAIAWAAYQTMESMPWWPVNVELNYTPVVEVPARHGAVPVGALAGFDPLGSQFPLALASVASGEQDAGTRRWRRLCGEYGWRDFRRLVRKSGLRRHGSVMQHTQQGLIGVSAISGLLMLALAPAGGESAKAKLNFALTVLFAMVISGVLVVTVPELNRDFVAYGRFSPVRAGRSEVIYVGEGRMGLVAVSKLTDGTLNYHNAGKIQASSDPADMRLQRMLGHLTTLVPKTQKNFLVIGFGAGATAGAVSIEPKLEQETIVEIEPLVPEFVSKYFGDHNFKVAENPEG